MLNNNNFISQYILIVSFLIILTIGMDISFFYGILRYNLAIYVILYQFFLKTTLISPLIFIILKQKEKLNNIEKYLNKIYSEKKNKK